MKAISTRAGGGLATACGLALCVLDAHRLSANTFVTFQVDMAVEPSHGDFNRFGESVIAEAYEWHAGERLPSWRLQLTNDPAAANPYLYKGTGLITNDAPDAILSYRFFVEKVPGGGSWDITRSVRLPAAERASLVLPVAYYANKTPEGNVVTNTIALTFQLDMTAQVNLGGFKPESDWVEVGARCDPEFVTYGYSLTNNPQAPNTHLYTTTVLCTNFTPGGIVSYRFSYYDSARRWFAERPLSTYGEERTAILPAAQLGAARALLRRHPGRGAAGDQRRDVSSGPVGTNASDSGVDTAPANPRWLRRLVTWWGRSVDQLCRCNEHRHLSRHSQDHQPAGGTF